MKCFLHIGTEKTATTTIQNFFNINRQKLLERGVIYTKSSGETNNRGLSVAAYNSNKRDDFTKQCGIDSDRKLLDFQKQTIFDLKEEIARISTNNSELKIIFSSEHFQSRLTQIEEIKRLKDIIYSFGVSDISVVVYLRRPAEIANSLYSTALKSGGVAECPPPPTAPYFGNVCNHRSTLEKFGSVFGMSALVPRIFDQQEFKNGSIIDDLLNVINISDSSTYIIPKSANESLSVLGVSLLRRLNQLVPEWVDDKPNKIRADLATYLEKHFSYGAKYVMPKSMYEKYDLEFRESNEWVRKMYFSDRDILFSEEVPAETVQKISDVDLDLLTKFIASIWNDKQEQIIRISKSHTWHKFHS